LGSERRKNCAGTRNSTSRGEKVPFIRREEKTRQLNGKRKLEVHDMKEKVF
jgi:hypothetical protein